MDRLFTSANLYYAVLERFGFLFWIRSKWAWLLAMSFAAMLLGTWQYIFEAKSSRLPLDWALLYIVVPEMLFLYALRRVRDIKTTAALDRINTRYDRGFTSLHQGRRFLLNRFFGRKESAYLGFADEIGKVMVYRDQLKVPMPTRFSDFARLVYDPDSKQRIYALLIVIASALTALAVRGGGGISDVFALSELGAGSIIFFWLTFTMSLGFILVALLIIRVGLVALIAFLTVHFEGTSARDPLTLRYLQRDLLNFHRFVHLQPAN